MNLDSYIENKKPKFRQGLSIDNDFSIEYYFNKEPSIILNKIPKTNSLSIHSSIENSIVNIKEYKPPKYYVAKTKNVNVTAMNNAGSVNVVGKNDIIFNDVSTRYDFDDFAYKEDYNYSGDNVLLSLDSGSNYFHWLCQILPRIKLMQEYKIEWKKINKILIPEIRGRFVAESLSALNVPMEKVIEQKSGCCYKFENLYIPCKPNNHIYLSNWSIDFLRETFLQGIEDTNNQKVFISRKESSARYIENEKSIYKLLKRFGFKRFYLEDMSIAEQASLFNNATHIVATHGASLANLVFCKQSTKVIELFNPFHFHSLYWSISNLLDLDYYYMISSSSCTKQYKGSSLHIDKSDLKLILEHACQ